MRECSECTYIDGHWYHCSKYPKDRIARVRKLKGNECFYYVVDEQNNGVWHTLKEFPYETEARNYYDFITAPESQTIVSNYVSVKAKEIKERG